MEKLSHSRRPNNSVHSLTRNSCNVVAAGFGSSKATTFEDVFGGPPRFGTPSLSPRLEDYCEIFGGFHVSSRGGASSIPVLDLPVIDDGDVYFDVASPGFDYGEVFGGFQDVDFAPSYDELLMEQFDGADDDSCDEAWTPGGTGSISDETEHSGKNPCFSNRRESYESLDGATDFGISYNKAGQRVDNGITRVASVPGYTYAIDESAHAEAMEGKQLKKTWSYPAHSDTKGHNSGNDLKSHKSYSRMQSCPGERFVSVSDISLKTVPSELPPPSRPPPLLRKNSNSPVLNCRSTGSEGSLEGSSPPFFDMEINASSAAVKDAMEKAQAKLKCTKEVLERKKDESRIHVKPTSVNGRMVREEKSSGKEMFFFVGSREVEKRYSVGKKSLEDKPGRKSIDSQGSDNLDTNDEWKKAYPFYELVRTEKLRNAVENDRVHNNIEFREARQNENLSTEEILEKEQERRLKKFVDNNDAEKLLKRSEVTIDAQRDKKHEKKVRVGKHILQKGIEEKYKKVVQHVESCDGSERHKNWGVSEYEENETFAQQPTKPKKREMHQKQTVKDIKDQKQFKKSLSREPGRNEPKDMFDWEENARKLREALAMAENEEMLEAVQEQDIDGNTPKGSVPIEESEKKLTEALERVENERRCALDSEPEDLKRLKEDHEKEQNELRLKEDLAKAEKRMNEDLEKGEKRRLKEAREKEEHELRLREALEQAENLRKVKAALEQEALERDERQRQQTEAREKEEKYMKLKEALEKEEKERRLKEAIEKEENELRLREALEQAEKLRKVKAALEQEALERDERERQQTEAREKEEKYMKLKEALEKEEKERRLKEAIENEEIERRQAKAENERLRKIEEEKEREREREKDRMAMGQRALAEARERLEKAFSEARDKNLGEKSLMEATLRAEKAAVERATTVTRERAAGRTASEAKERIERPVPDKQFQSSNSFGASRYQNPSSGYVGGVDGESLQRHTSRSERHRRTAERVAKALTEKNMRDLLVQKEQAERNRLAETLDADVKRWSSGKQGNIRALLSTLQYILGPESGWQPIHLTEVITSAAVKRAYRKATLCVHPDKLQQRGANIHQKYICEKVFDLLKEAWNRFNSEER